MVARVAARTGLLGELRLPGLVELLRTAARGVTGPSAIFRVHGAAHPDRPAFQFDGRTLSYGEVDERIDRLATGLRQRGLGSGDTAVSVVRNRPEAVELSAAMSRLGGSTVAVSWRSTATELAYVAQHSGAKAIFFEADLWPVIEAAHRQLKSVSASALFPVGGEIPGQTSIETLLQSKPDRHFDPREGAVIIYTSGTTGRPKGAVRRFGIGQIKGFFAFICETPMRVDDRHLSVCPMYHSTGLGFVGMTLMLGGTVVIQREFDPEQFLATVERERITTTAIVPTMLYRLMALPDDVLHRYDLRSLRAVFCGGAQLPGPLALQALDRLGPVLYNFYGATETGLVTLATPHDLRAAPGTIGHPLPGTEILLLDEQGQPVRQGEVGELYARNAMLVEGYYADEASTRASMHDGFFSVGDLARQDETGRYFIVGRKRDMVISGGVNIYPAEIETVIESHPAVAQAAVIGLPDPEWGEKLRAFVVPKHGQSITGETLRNFCRERLAGPKVPREWVFVDALPSNPTGKILKRELKEYQGPVERA